jgi:uncharacterized protein YecT (DUF1311 family)
LFVTSTCVLLNAQENASPRTPPVPQDQTPPLPVPQSPAPAAQYDKGIFQPPVPADQLTFLNQFAGKPAGDLIRDKQFRKLMHSVIPDCVFHYGWDMSIPDALDRVFKSSGLPVQIRGDRYLTMSGRSGPYLGGRGMIWIDLQDGVVLGAFYFHPSNGEPTPTLTVFSKQVKEATLKMSQLPPAFYEDLSQWSRESRVSPVTTRYFIGGLNKKIVLEHDEDYCVPVDGTVMAPDNVCEAMDADAADIDLNAAYYLDQTKHATNATAWMITGQEQVAWLAVRDRTCGAGPNPLGCRIRMTRERTAVIIRRNPLPRR